MGYLGLTTDLDAAWSALQRADLLQFGMVVLGFSLALFVTDAWTLWVMAKRLQAGGPLKGTSFADMRRVKGVSYFLNAINYSAGAAAMAYLLKRLRRVPLLLGASLFIWLALVDVIGLLLMMSIGCLVAGDLLPPSIASGLPVALAVGWAVIIGLGLYWNANVDFWVLGRFRTWRVFEAFRRASLRDVAFVLTARLCFLLVYTLFDWAVLPSFQIEIGLGPMLVFSPILAFMQIVPGSISGLGAVQPVIIALYSDFVASSVADPRAQVFAFSTVFGPAVTVGRLLIGYVFLGGVLRQMLPSREQLSSASETVEREGRAGGASDLG